MQDRSAPGARALAGVRIIDFSHFIAGPFCTMILADLGADVVKVENAASSGDNMRAFHPQVSGESGPFLWANRNKRSVALDLTSAAGREVARDLIATADVLVENFSTGVMERFGLGYETLAPDHPRLIYCSVSAYGRQGPLADRTGFDPMVQAESGFMSLNGYADGEPLRAGPAVMDMATGMMASNAVLAALAARDKQGKGQRLEVALFDVAVTMLGFHAMNYLLTDIAPRRFGNNSFDTAPMGVFMAADGPLYLACANDRLYRRLSNDVFGRPDLATQATFATNRDRVLHRDALFAQLNEIFATDQRERWLAKLRAAGVPGPYVLAGHSLGGLFVRLYASTYPLDVLGLILADAYSERLETLLTPGRWSALVRFNVRSGSDTIEPIPSYGDLETIGLGTDNVMMRQATATTPLRGASCRLR